jgi:hypothetical protein
MNDDWETKAYLKDGRPAMYIRKPGHALALDVTGITLAPGGYLAAQEFASHVARLLNTFEQPQIQHAVTDVAMGVPMQPPFTPPGLAIETSVPAPVAPDTVSGASSGNDGSASTD